jgi:uncharacterized protein YndB with AHSA1/START domain
MATAQITPDNNAVLAEIFVAAPPERVFQAFADPAQKMQWWGAKNLYRITEYHSDLRPGGKWKSVGVGADGKSFQVDGEYLEIDPPRLIVHTWNPSFAHLRHTVVRIEFIPQDVHNLQSGGPRRAGTGTLVKIRHEGFAGDAVQAQSHGEGWKRVLGWMQAFAETGATVDTRDA